MKTKALLMCAAAFLTFGNIAFAGDPELCTSELAKGAYESAFRYCEKACILDYADGCYELGSIYERGLGLRQNNKLAKEYYGRACDLEYQPGCDGYSRLHEQGY